MLSLSDIIFTSILPLTLGMSVAIVLGHFVRSPLGPAVGAWVTLVTGYFGCFATMNFAYADGETLTQKIAQSVSQTAAGLLSPPTAIQWIPIFATAALATTVIVAHIKTAVHAEHADDALRSLWSSRWLSGSLICAVLVALSTAAVVRLLWTSVYFTGRFVWTAQIGYVAVPTILIATVWFSAFCERTISRETPARSISRWANVSTFLLSASALVLLASSGSFTIGLLQLPALSAVLVSTVFHQPKDGPHSFGGDAWLIASAVCFPVVIGFFFAELRWETAALFAFSAILAAWMPPYENATNARKIGAVVVSALPAIAAAVWAAILLSRAIEPTYGGYQ